MRQSPLRVLMFVATALIGLASPPEARAANTWSFVGANITGAGDCSSPTDTCRLEFAIANTNEGGVITCVASGRSDVSVTITKTLTINCKEAGYLLEAALVINAPGKAVKLSGITVNTGGNGAGGSISIQSAASVDIEHGSIGNTNSGQPGTACIKDTRSGPAKLLLLDTQISDCGSVGILLVPGSGTLTVAFDNVRSWNNTYGLAAGSGARVMIDRSTFSGNTTAGIEADAGAFIGVNNSLISSNAIGVLAGGTIAISNSDINSNSTAISGVTQSSGNNRIFANGVDGTPPSVVAQH